MEKLSMRMVVCLMAMAWTIPGYAGWAILDQAQEVPAPQPVAGAIGVAVFDLNSAGTELSYSITVTGLSGAISAAHIHGPADPGTSASPVRTLTFTGNHASGVWKNTDTQPLSAALVEALKAGRLYVNIHTALNGGGEIRGNINMGESYNAGMDQAQEVPAPQPAPGAAGTGVVLLNPNGTEATIHVVVTGLSGAISAGHIHGPADPGTSASPVRTLTFNGNYATNVWKSSDSSQPLTATHLQSLMDGKLYFNVHTALNGAGEIRGQIRKVGSQLSSVSAFESYP